MTFQCCSPRFASCLSSPENVANSIPTSRVPRARLLCCPTNSCPLINPLGQKRRQ